MNNYKVCILAAGVGSRMGELSNNVNKAILPVNFKGVISYIIEKFSKEIEIVIAVGHKKETIINYVNLAHSDRKITYVNVDKYMGPGTGPGYSLLECKNNLQCPFIFFAADTIVLEEIPPPTQNWFGIAPVKDTEKYCTVKIKNNLVYQIDDKVKTDNKFAFIGLAGIHNYEDFFAALERNKELISNEIQVSNGFKKLVEKKLVPVGFTWFDTGELESYKKTNTNFVGEEKKFNFSKGDEFLYFVNERVIKYFANPAIAENRVKRADILKGLCPEIEGKEEGFYSYKKLDGHTLYNVLNVQLLNDFLYWAKSNLWNKLEISNEDKIEFDNACKRFYYDKTMKRLKMFYAKKGVDDAQTNINGISVPPLQLLLDKIDWQYISKGIPSNFHGDLQFDNVLVTKDPMTHLPKFVLLDWRQDFGGLINFGDLYYDLAKLYGGLILSYQLIKDGMFSFDMSGSSVYYNYYMKNDLLEAKSEYEKFIKKNGFDLNKIKILTSLIFLNMSPLHHDPFDLLLYYLGKKMLYNSLNDLEEEREIKID